MSFERRLAQLPIVRLRGSRARDSRSRCWSGAARAALGRPSRCVAWSSRRPDRHSSRTGCPAPPAARLAHRASRPDQLNPFTVSCLSSTDASIMRIHPLIENPRISIDTTLFPPGRAPEAWRLFGLRDLLSPDLRRALSSSIFVVCTPSCRVRLAIVANTVLYGPFR